MSHPVTMVQPAAQGESSLQELDAKEAAVQEKAPTGPDGGDYATASYADIAKEFSLMGWAAFGGPAAHVGMFEKVRSPTGAGDPASQK
jgi:hypothetical protein